MQNEILHLLNTHGAQTAAVLAMGLKVSPKTVRRHIKTLVDTGAVIRNDDATFMVPNKVTIKKIETRPEPASTPNVDALIEQTASEIKEAAEAKAAGKTPKVLGFRATSRNGNCAKVLLERGTLTQPEISNLSTHSTDWITKVVKLGYATFDKATKTVTLTEAGKASV